MVDGTDLGTPAPHGPLLLMALVRLGPRPRSTTELLVPRHPSAAAPGRRHLSVVAGSGVAPVVAGSGVTPVAADSTAVVAVDPTAAAEATAVEAVDRRLKDLSLAAQAFWPALFLFFLHRFPG